MKYIIVGAVAGGASAAARLRRLDEHASILLFEKGEYISYANCGLPYYIGDIIKERNKLLVQTAASFGGRFNVDVRVRTEIISIDRAAKTVTALDHTSGKQYTERYDKLVLSPGAEPIRPPLPGIGLEGIFTLRNVNDMDYIKSYLASRDMKKAVVVGAGFIGIEMAENLHELGLEVSIVEMQNQVLAPVDYSIAAIAQQHIRSKGVELRLNSAVAGFEAKGSQLLVRLDDAAALEADIVILSIGVRADTRLAAAAGLEVGEARGIKVNEYLQTSDPDIYAVGDAIEFPNPLSGKPVVTYLAGPANKQGRICADNIAGGGRRSYKGSVNTAIVKVFDLTVAAAGMAVKLLQANAIPHIVSTLHAGSHAGYYPGAQQMTIQIAFAPQSGRLLSAQIVGRDGVDKRMDVFSHMIQTGQTVYDLAEFEQAYAPPYSSAKDPVNMSGFVAENILEGRVKMFYWNEIDSRSPNALLVDVRTPAEFSRGTIDNALNIPVDDLRERIEEIPADKEVMIFCQQGMRGYLAHRVLQQQGISNVVNLSGGYQLWKTASEEYALLNNKNQHILQQELLPR